MTDTSYPQLIQNPFADSYVADTYDPSGTALTYESGHFAIVNEDASVVTLDSSYNVFSPAAGDGVSQHTSISTNTAGPVSQITDDYTDAHPERIVLATHLAPQLFPHPFGLTYPFGHWTLIQNDANGNDFPAGLTFNIYAQDPSFTAFKRAAAAVVGNYTIIDHPLLNDEPCAHVFVSSDFVDTHSVEVAYVGNRRAIVNLGSTSMPTNATFSVFIDEAATDFCKYDHIFHNAFDAFD